MSHFCVMVICDTEEQLDSLLAPYDESTDQEQYLEFHDIGEEYRRMYEEDGAHYILLENGLLEPAWLEKHRNRSYPPRSREVLIPYKVMYPSFDEWMVEWMLEDKAENGRYGYWENPNAKWDWYVIGGRWSGFFRNIDGTTCNHARLSEIDWRPDPVAERDARLVWDQVVNGVDHGAQPGIFDTKEGLTSRFGSVELFAKHRSADYPYSVVTPDGKWHSLGNMGWFGISDENADQVEDWVCNFRERFVDPYLHRHAFIVDCHI